MNNKDTQSPEKGPISAEELQMLLENMDGVVYQTEMDEQGSLRITYASTTLFKVMGRVPGEVGQDGRDALSMVFPEDRENLQAAIRDAGIAGSALNHQFRVFYSDGEVQWRHVHGMRLPGREDGIIRMLHLVTDISAHRREKAVLQEKERIVDFALRNTDINIWYFDCEKQECVLGENCQESHEMTGVEKLNDFPECLINMGYVREDSIEPLRKAYQQLWETGKGCEFDAWFRKADGSGWWCEHDMLTAITDQDGNVTRGIGIGKNVTTEKELEEQYRAFQNYRTMGGKDAFASFYMNITTGSFGNCVTQDETIKAVYGDIDSLDTFFWIVHSHITMDESQDYFKNAFSRSSLLSRFSHGETSLNFKLHYRRENGEALWLNNVVQMMKNPASGDVEALLYVFDINYEKNMDFLVDRLLDVDYEFLGLIDVATGKLEVFGKNKDAEGMAQSGAVYDHQVARVFKGLIPAEYREEGIRTMSLDHVIQQLREKEYYTCSFPAKAYVNTREGRKQWKFAYLDSSKSQILIARTDITEMFTAERDSLTGLYNRQGFYRHVREMLNAHQEEPFLLIRCDIDRFKAYNDVYGLEAGDQLLAGFGRAVRQRSWPVTTVFGRIERDHFCILFPKNLMDIAMWEEVRKAWMSSAVPGYHMHGSVGVYEIINPHIDVSLMCDRAFMALRVAKDGANGKVYWYDERLRDVLMEEQALADDMEAALLEEQFVLHFQPQICYSTGELVGIEVLVRWDHPVRGFLYPGSFIPIFEKNGFIMNLDAYVWEKSCAHLRRLLDEDSPLAQIPVSVNISRCDLNDPALCETLCALVEKYHLPFSLLRLEITESAYMEDPDQLIEITNKLQRLGFIVEMDDFGTGYSSLNMLKDVPVDVLKLDMQFITEVGTNPRSEMILSAIIHLADKLGLPVIAEGVETSIQADYLKSLGCVDMQGYFFSRPIPEDELRRVFSDGYWKPETDLLK